MLQPTTPPPMTTTLAVRGTSMGRADATGRRPRRSNAARDALGKNVNRSVLGIPPAAARAMVDEPERPPEPSREAIEKSRWLVRVAREQHASSRARLSRSVSALDRARNQLQAFVLRRALRSRGDGPAKSAPPESGEDHH